MWLSVFDMQVSVGREEFKTAGGRARSYIVPAESVVRSEGGWGDESGEAVADWPGAS